MKQKAPAVPGNWMEDSCRYGEVYANSRKPICHEDPVIPAQAGIQSIQCFLDPRLRGDDKLYTA